MSTLLLIPNSGRQGVDNPPPEDDPLPSPFALPVVCTPDMSPEEWRYRVDMMLIRSKAEGDLLNERITFDEYLEIVRETDISGADLDKILQTWKAGGGYL